MQAEKVEQEFINSKIGNRYRKTLLIDLATDTFKIGQLAQDERDALAGLNIEKTSEYWRWFCESEFLHDGSRQECLDFKLEPNSEIIYSRRVGEEWHFMILEVSPLDGYGKENSLCLLSVRDIDDIYRRHYDDVVDKIGTKDPFTGLLNRVALERDVARHANEKVGVIFADLNGLKWTNDNMGHKAGDDLIQKFSGLLSVNFGDYRCYHISGDEFVVMSYGKSLKEFVSRAIAFHKSMWLAMDIPIASVGYSVGEEGELQLAYEEAEREMYDDKRIFYSKFPKYKRQN